MDDIDRSVLPVPDHQVVPVPSSSREGWLQRLREYGDMDSSAVSGRAKVIAALLILALFGVLSYLSPLGSFVDAIVIWNLHAKFLMVAPIGIVYPAYSHPDYPPLLSLLVALGWRVVGVTPVIPVLIQGMVLATILYVLRRSFWRMVLFGVWLAPYSSNQISDVPLSLCVLLAVVAMQKGRWWLMGIALGFALLTKNEGSLIALAFLCSSLVVHGKRAWASLVSLAPFLLFLLLYKSLVNMPNDVMASQDIFERALTWWRYPVVAAMTIWLTTFNCGPVIALAIVGLKMESSRLDQAVLLGCAIVLAGYFMIYVITPHDIWWHVSNSVDRLVVHLFPSLIFATKVNGRA